MGAAKQVFHEVSPHPKKRQDDYALAVFIALGLLCTSLLAPAYSAESPPVDIHRLIRNVAYNELHARSHPAHYYRYMQREKTPQGSQTTLQIGTREGTVERLIKVNGKPPSAKQCRKSLSQLERITASPKLQQSRFRSQQADMKRREILFGAMPNAFIYHFDGIEKGTGWIRLTYEPNPDFQPTSRSEGVLAGLAGTLWIDPVSQRLARINGRLRNDVTFGWGILARLYAGGHFEMKQSRIGDGSWQLASLAVAFQGRVLLFKGLHVNMKDVFSSYERVANKLTVSEAVAQLEHVHVQCLGE